MLCSPAVAPHVPSLLHPWRHPRRHPRRRLPAQAEQEQYDKVDDVYLEMYEALDERLGPAFLEARQRGDAEGVREVAAEVRAWLGRLYGCFRKTLLAPRYRQYFQASLYDAYDLLLQCGQALGEGPDGSALHEVRGEVRGLVYGGGWTWQGKTRTRGCGVWGAQAEGRGAALSQCSGQAKVLPGLSHNVLFPLRTLHPPPPGAQGRVRGVPRLRPARHPGGALRRLGGGTAAARARQRAGGGGGGGRAAGARGAVRPGGRGADGAAGAAQPHAARGGVRGQGSGEEEEEEEEEEERGRRCRVLEGGGLTYGCCCCDPVRRALLLPVAICRGQQYGSTRFEGA